MVTLFFLQIRVFVRSWWVRHVLLKWLWIDFLALPFLSILHTWHLKLINDLRTQIHVCMITLALALFFLKNFFFYPTLFEHATFKLAFLIYLFLFVILLFLLIFLLNAFTSWNLFSSKIWLIYLLINLTWLFIFILFFFFLAKINEFIVV